MLINYYFTIIISIGSVGLIFDPFNLKKRKAFWQAPNTPDRDAQFQSMKQL